MENYEVSDALIFISYSRDDSELAAELANDLERAGLKVWTDRFVSPGERWDSAVQNALMRSYCILVLLSPAAVHSDNVLDEVNFGLEENKTLIPVVVRKCILPFRLRRFQRIDLSESYRKGLERLLKVFDAPSKKIKEVAFKEKKLPSLRRKILWEKPHYEFRSSTGEKIVIDLISSTAPARLLPSSVFVNEVIPFLKRKNSVKRVVDILAGPMRHTLPLLQEGFQVCAVEYPEVFHSAAGKMAIERVQDCPNFEKIISPNEFVADKHRFDAAFLCFVLQRMPVPKERLALLKVIEKKLNKDGYLLYMSTVRELNKEKWSDEYRVNDGVYTHPKRKTHGFYREFTTKETDTMIEDNGFHKVRSLGQGGRSQVFLYQKGRSYSWV